jgi:hypothetical protein
MLKREQTRFAALDCLKLENGALALWVTRTLGPRIIGLALHGGESLFAELPDATLDYPGEGTFYLRGGHRLWHAPEDPQRTYIPDNDPVVMEDVPGGVRIIQPVEAQTGIRKSITVTLPDDGAQVLVDHSLQNLGQAPVELAPWAITQVKPGGMAILPQTSGPMDEAGVLPNRVLALWPYTSVTSPHITWGDRYILVDANLQQGALKLGFPNPEGWLGYILEDTLFVKHAEYRPGAFYYDHGSSSECYCNPQFLELETLGPRATLAPGDSLSHREHWQIYSQVAFSENEDELHALLTSLGI